MATRAEQQDRAAPIATGDLECSWGSLALPAGEETVAMTEGLEPDKVSPLDEILRIQFEQAEQLKVIKGQLTDLPVISSKVGSTRLDIRHDLRELRDQVAELPGIRTHLEEQAQQLAMIGRQVAQLLELFERDEPTVDDTCSAATEC